MNLYFFKYFIFFINFLLLLKNLNASYCGQAAIPYSLEVLKY